VAVLLVLLADRFGWIPGGMYDLGNDVRVPERRAPVYLADAHRVVDDDRLLVRARLGKVIQPVLGQVDHDPLAGAGRQNVAARKRQPLPGAGKPHVHTRVRADDLVVAEAVAMRDIRKRVFVDGRDVGVFTDDRGAIGGKRIETRSSGTACCYGERERTRTPQQGLHVPRGSDAYLRNTSTPGFDYRARCGRRAATLYFL